jgi:hypothetical protein
MLRSRRIVAVVAALGFIGAVPATQAVARPAAPVAIAATTCGAGYKHAVINGAEKCLRRGEFCAHGADSQYRRYGYKCVSQDDRGNYHLT